MKRKKSSLNDTIERNNWQAYYDEFEKGCLDRGVSSVEAKQEATTEADKKVNFEKK